MPIDIYINGKKRDTLGPGYGTITLLAGVILTYFGDEFRGFGLTQNDQYVTSGQIPTDYPIVAQVNNRLIPHIDVGQPSTRISDSIKIVYRQK